MKLNNVLYFGDFVAIPAAIVAFAGVAIYEGGVEAIGPWLFAFVVGLFVWSFVEYVVHRWVYHAIPFFERFHDAHHREPEALLGVPSFVSGGVMLLGFFAPALLAVGLVGATGFASGAMLGYAGYMLVHHASHHWDLKPGSLLYRLRVLHMAHHYHQTPGNYGIITSFWDRVFSTNVERRRRDRVAGA